MKITSFITISILAALCLTGLADDKKPNTKDTPRVTMSREEAIAFLTPIAPEKLKPSVELLAQIVLTHQPGLTDWIPQPNFVYCVVKSELGEFRIHIEMDVSTKKPSSLAIEWATRVNEKQLGTFYFEDKGLDGQIDIGRQNEETLFSPKDRGKEHETYWQVAFERHLGACLRELEKKK